MGRWSTIPTTLSAECNSPPIIVGLDWLTGCDEPDKDGLVRDRGGHEVEAYPLDVEEELVHLYYSWSPSWGVRRTFSLTFDDFGRALERDGDVVVPVAK